MTEFSTEHVSGLFSAIGQSTRLEILKCLAPVSQGDKPAGMPAGEIARRLKLPPATLSFHLKDMTYKGLLLQERQGRSMIYRVNVHLLLASLEYLVSEICEA